MIAHDQPKSNQRRDEKDDNPTQNMGLLTASLVIGLNEFEPLSHHNDDDIATDN